MLKFRPNAKPKTVVHNAFYKINMTERIFLLLCFCFSINIVSAQSTNVLKNPNFELNTTDWTIINSVKIQTDTFKTGNASLMVSQTHPSWSGVSQVIYLPEEIYTAEISGWIKTKNVVRGKEIWEQARICIEIQDKYEFLINGYPPEIGQCEGNTNWTYYKNSYLIPKGAKQLKVFAFLANCTGTAWFDDLQVHFLNNKGDTLKAGEKPQPDFKDFKALYSKEQLQNDFNEMIVHLKSHPSPYEFLKKSKFDSLISNQYSKINDSLTINEFYTICAPIVAKVGCCHTVIKDKRRDALSPEFYFPMQVYFNQNRMFVIKSGTSLSELTPGSEIIKINDKDVSEIYNTIFTIIPTDGYNKAGKQMLLNWAFNYYYALIYGAFDKFTITYMPFGLIEKKICSFTTDDYVIAQKTKPDTIHCLDANLCFNLIKEKNTALITIRSFVYYQQVDYFKKFIDDCFIAIDENKIDNLIIDLRGGGGGDPYCSSYLLTYLIDKPIVYFNKEAKYYEDLKETINPNKKRFKGKPYILIDGGSFSTSGHLNALMKYHQVGQFVGQETGATYSCNAMVKNFTLNNTKLSLDVAQGTYAVDVKPFPKDRGIIPDYEVIPTLNDIISDKDVVLEMAFELITQKQDLQRARK